MAQPDFVKPRRIWLQKHPTLDEKWVQQWIAEDPETLGLGDLVLRDKERHQPHAGRLDLLLQDPESDRRYEVEVQLGRTDESHIIRTIEYWDIEKKRYPRYEHCAVIVAEDITSRFLNVIGLFNGRIPLVAIQMQVLEVGDKTTIVFTKVLDQIALGEEDDDGDYEAANREGWEEYAGKKTLAMMDQCSEILRAFDADLDLNYTQGYVGLVKGGRVNNFVIFGPRKNVLRVEPRLPQSEDLRDELDSSGLDLMGYDAAWGRSCSVESIVADARRSSS